MPRQRPSGNGGTEDYGVICPGLETAERGQAKTPFLSDCTSSRLPKPRLNLQMPPDMGGSSKGNDF